MLIYTHEYDSLLRAESPAADQLRAQSPAAILYVSYVITCNQMNLAYLAKYAI